ncbi:MAG: serine O-acetyltransferase [Chloroflexi bacterium]|nr:serine O-acetyltransferase [Chloroflexota bacterium]
MNFVSRIQEDVRTVFAKDPAARSALEVVLLYPGLHAMWAYRIAHFLWRHKLHFWARMISESARWFTGIEIHPGAVIGRRFFIDHGMGVVIGETSEIGDDVLMYQGVVLGGTTLEKAKRHPTIGNNVVIGSAAVLLGPIVVGEGARVGANSVVVKSVPPGVTVVGVPGRIVESMQEEAKTLEHGKLPDPFAMVINLLISEQAIMEERVKKLEQAAGLVLAPQAETRALVHRELVHAQSIFTEGGGI